MSAKIAIDRFIGLPILLALRLPCRVLGVLLRRDHMVQRDQVRTIVVAKFMGLGSLVQATPMLQGLRGTFPKARLILLTSRGLRPIAQVLPMIDEALEVDDRSLPAIVWSTAWCIVRLISRRVDLYFDLEVFSAYSSIVSLLSTARNRMGFYRYSTSFKRGINTHLMYFNTRRPVRELYVQLARLAGVECGDPHELGPLRLDAAAEVRLREKMTRIAPGWTGGGYLVLNPNASDLLPERKWPAESFASVASHWALKGRTVVLIGAKTEEPYTSSVLAMVDPSAQARIVNTAGRLDLQELCALLAHASAVVTNDTGPMHLSVALGAPTVCLFGPVHPDHYGIRKENVRTLYRAVFCSPCVHEIDRPPCNGDNVCMQLIGTGEVNEAVEGLLQGDPAKGADEARSLPLTVSMDARGRPLGMVTNGSVGEGWAPPCQVCGAREFIRLFQLGTYRLWRCRACRLVRLYPQPSDPVLSRIYGETYYRAWGLDRDPATARRIKSAFFQRQLRAHLALPAGARILDCGAAVGHLMDVAKEMGLDPYGVELSAFGAGRIGERFGKDRVFAGRFEDASFPQLNGPHFDAVCMFDFIEHVRDPRGVVAKAAAFLKPGGVLLLCTPDAGSLGFRWMRSAWPHTKVEHLFYFNRRNLALLLESEGLRVETAWWAVKRMSLDYLDAQFAAHPAPVFGRAVRLLRKATPERLCRVVFPVSFGEMIVCGRKV